MIAAPPGEDAAIGVAIDFATYHALVQLYADYAYAVDSGDWDLWPNSSSTTAATASCRARTTSAACRSRRSRSRARGC